VEVIVEGAGFDPRIVADFGCGAKSLTVDDEFLLALNGASLQETTWIDHLYLSTTVPSTLSSGDYEIELRGPDGRRFAGTVPYITNCMEPSSDTENASDTMDTTTEQTETWTETQATTSSTDTDSQTQNTNTDTQSDSQTPGTDTESNTQDTSGETSCEDLAAKDSRVVCCPDPPPPDCSTASWHWDGQDHNSVVGCCASATGPAIRCTSGALTTENCDFEDLCVHVDGQSRQACAHNSCMGPIWIDPTSSPDGVTWQGSFMDYEDTWQTSDSWNCQLTKYTDVWFEIVVPIGEKLLVDASASKATVVIRWIESCQVRTCIQSERDFEKMFVTNAGPNSTVHITLVPNAISLYNDFQVSFSLVQ
jgi:hypothetical protein